MMDSTLLIFACVALGAVAVLCVTLAIVALQAGKNLGRLTTTMEAVGNDVSEIKSQAIPLIEKATTVMQRTDVAMTKLDGSLDNLENGARALRGIAEDTRKLEQEVLRRVQPALEDITSLVSGAVKGLSTFIRNVMDR
jgi:uncharacterized protein YoxC